MRTPIQARVVITGIAALLLGGCADSPPVEETPPAIVASAKPATKPAENPAARAGHLPGRVTRIALGDLFALQQSGNVLIYDVRPAFFHSLGNIPGSVNWPTAAYEKQLAIREPEIRAANRAGRPVVLYCADLACPDARNVATWLAERGHSTSVLEGGWDAWKTGGLPGS